MTLTVKLDTDLYIQAIVVSEGDQRLEREAEHDVRSLGLPSLPHRCSLLFQHPQYLPGTLLLCQPEF